MKTWIMIVFLFTVFLICSGHPAGARSEQIRTQTLQQGKDTEILESSVERDNSGRLKPADGESIDTKALSLIFMDGFESGDTSAWGAQPEPYCPPPTLDLP